MSVPNKAMKLKDGKILYDDLRTRIENTKDTKADVIINSASGSIAHFEDGADNMPLNELIVSFEPGQEGSGDPSPTNVRPIVGINGLSIVDANIAPIDGVYTISPTQSGSGDPSLTNIRPIFPGLSFVRDDNSTLNVYGGSIDPLTGTLTVTHDCVTPNADGSWVKSTTYIYQNEYPASVGDTNSVLSAQISHFTNAGWDLEGYICVSSISLFVIGFTPLSEFGINTTGTETEISTAINTWLTTQENNGTPLQVCYALKTPYTIQLSSEELSRALTALGISKRTAAIDWTTEAGTVYGGTLDVLNGILSVTHTIINLKAAAMYGTWDSDTGKGAYWYTSGIQNLSNNNDGVICNKLITQDVTSTNDTIACMTWYTNGIIRWIEPDTMTMTKDEYNSYLDQNPLTVTYKLAEPITYQLSTHAITTLKGVNNIWSDAGDISVSYSADTKAYTDSKVSDVRVDGLSITQNGVANIPIMSDTNYGVIKLATYGAYANSSGLQVSDGVLSVATAQPWQIAQGLNGYQPVCPATQHLSTFHGLAKAAGDTTQSTSSNSVGTYTDAAKESIQHMLGTDTMIAPHETDLSFSSQAYSAGDVITMNGKLYVVTASIQEGGTIQSGTNCEETSVASEFIKNTDYATTSNYGLVKMGYSSSGLQLDSSGYIKTSAANATNIKEGTDSYKPIVPNIQHASTFYGLAKAAGDTTQASSSNAVGTYTTQAKQAIQTMLGIGAASVTQTLTSGTAIATINGVTIYAPSYTDADGVSY